MRRLLFTLGLLALFASGATAEEPFWRTGTPASGNAPASLGLPRASVGLPRTASDSNAAPSRDDDFVPPIIRGISPSQTLRFQDDKLKMPREATKEGDGKKIVSSPEPIGMPLGNVIIPHSQGTPIGDPGYPRFIDQDEPLCRIPANAPPFIRDPARFRVSGEYIMWWMKAYEVPPLVTTGPAASNGILGAEGTRVLLGDERLDPVFRHGFRTNFVWYWGSDMRWGLDGTFLFLGDQGSTNAFRSDDGTVIARPFFNVNDGQRTAEIVADQNATGGILVTTGSYLWGGDMNFRRRICGWDSSRLDFLIGYRFLSLDEHLDIAEQSTGTGQRAGISGTAFDRFRTVNNFHGAQFGLAYETNWGRWVIDTRLKVAMGTTRSSVDIDGGQTRTENGVTTNARGGLYALDSNIGLHKNAAFGLMPEFTFNLGYQFTDHCRLFIGYNFLYWSSVLRPGDQIDQRLDINRIPNFTRSNNQVTQATPSVLLRDKDFWVQGFNFGLMFRW